MGDENLDESFERLLLTSDSEDAQRIEEDSAGDEDEDEEQKINPVEFEFDVIFTIWMKKEAVIDESS